MENPQNPVKDGFRARLTRRWHRRREKPSSSRRERAPRAVDGHRTAARTEHPRGPHGRTWRPVWTFFFPLRRRPAIVGRCSATNPRSWSRGSPTAAVGTLRRTGLLVVGGAPHRLPQIGGHRGRVTISRSPGEVAERPARRTGRATPQVDHGTGFPHCSHRPARRGAGRPDRHRTPEHRMPITTRPLCAPQRALEDQEAAWPEK